MINMIKEKSKTMHNDIHPREDPVPRQELGEAPQAPEVRRTAVRRDEQDDAIRLLPIGGVFGAVPGVGRGSFSRLHHVVPSTLRHPVPRHRHRHILESGQPELAPWHAVVRRPAVVYQPVPLPPGLVRALQPQKSAHRHRDVPRYFPEDALLDGLGCKPGQPPPFLFGRNSSPPRRPRRSPVRAASSPLPAERDSKPFSKPPYYHGRRTHSGPSLRKPMQASTYRFRPRVCPGARPHVAHLGARPRTVATEARPRSLPLARGCL